MRNYIRIVSMFVALLVATWLLADKVFGLLMEYVGKRFYWLDSSIEHDVLIWLIGLCIVVWLYLQPKKQSLTLFLKFRRNAWALMLATFYLYASVYHRDLFAKFYIPDSLAYADVLMIWLAVWYLQPLLKYRKSRKTLKTLSSEDNPKQAKLLGDDNCPEDALGRKNEAKAICDYILDETNEYSTSLAISITGSWGSGKTVLMNYLKEKLDEKGITYFDYSPWQRSQNDVALDFLNLLSHHLDGQDIGLDSLEAYIKSLKVSNITGWFNLGLHALTCLITGNNKSTTELLDEASRDMQTLERPVVAFVDDVDRIGKDDILDVMRLIRATANFPNLVYIVAYDKERTLRLLGDEYGEGFLTKIFNVDHNLTNVNDEKLQELAFERFKEYGIRKETDSPFALIALSDYLPTIRDLKRYFNLLNKDYEAQAAMRNKTYFDFNYYAKLELLKHTDLFTYLMLKNEPTVYLDVDKDNWNDVSCYKTKEDLKMQNEATHQLLMQLFDQEAGEYNIFVCPGGLQMLFENDLDKSYVSKQEFEKAIKEDKLVENVKEWIKVNKQGIGFCLSKNLKLPIDTIVKVLEIMVENRPSDIVHAWDVNHYELIDNSSLDSLSRIDEVRNPYNYVGENHALFIYLQNGLNEGKKQEEQEIDKLRSYARKTERPRELLAIISGMMRQSWGNGIAPERWQFEIAEILFNVLVTKTPFDDIKNQYYVVEAMHYLPYYDATGNLLLQQLKQNPALWLRLTLNVDSDFGPYEKMTVNTKVLHSLFDTYELYKAVMDDLWHHFDGDEEKRQIIKEHQLLTQYTSLITAYSISQFNAENYPALRKILYKDKKNGIFMSSYYEDTKKMMKEGSCAFFNNEGEKPDLFEGGK